MAGAHEEKLADAKRRISLHSLGEDEKGGGSMRAGNLDQLYPKLKSPEGERLCRWCKAKLSGRKTSWCNEQCKDEGLIRCWPNHARYMVGQRDHGVCAICGKDTEKFRRRVRKWYFILQRKSGIETSQRFLRKRYKEGWPRLYRSWWEAHHIVPISHGGGLCGLHGYRTLCVPCHKKVTAETKRAEAA